MSMFNTDAHKGMCTVEQRFLKVTCHFYLAC